MGSVRKTRSGGKTKSRRKAAKKAAGKQAGRKAARKAARTARKKGAAKKKSAKKAGPGKKSGSKKTAAFKKRAKKRSIPAPDIEVDAEVLEFIEALDRYKKEYNRPFPSWSEVLHVLHGLGYRKARL